MTKDDEKMKYMEDRIYRRRGDECEERNEKEVYGDIKIQMI